MIGINRERPQESQFHFNLNSTQKYIQRIQNKQKRRVSLKHMLSIKKKHKQMTREKVQKNQFARTRITKTSPFLPIQKEIRFNHTKFQMHSLQILIIIIIYSFSQSTTVSAPYSSKSRCIFCARSMVPTHRTPLS